jgi:hypothetical protein
MHNDDHLPSPTDFNYSGGRIFVRLGRLKLSRYLSGPATGEDADPEQLALNDELSAHGCISPDSLFVLGRTVPPTENLKVVLARLERKQFIDSWRCARSELEYGIQYADQAPHPLDPALKPFFGFIDRALPDLDKNPPTSALYCNTTERFGADYDEWTLMVRLASAILEQITRDYLAGYRPSLTLSILLRTALNTHHESWRRADEPKVVGMVALPLAGASAYGWITGLKCTLHPPKASVRAAPRERATVGGPAASVGSRGQPEQLPPRSVAQESYRALESDPSAGVQAQRPRGMATLVTLGHYGIGGRWLRLLKALWR